MPVSFEDRVQQLIKDAEQRIVDWKARGKLHKVPRAQRQIEMLTKSLDEVRIRGGK